MLKVTVTSDYNSYKKLSLRITDMLIFIDQLSLTTDRQFSRHIFNIYTGTNVHPGMLKEAPHVHPLFT